MIRLFQMNFKYYNKHTSDICDPSSNLFLKNNKPKDSTVIKKLVYKNFLKSAYLIIGILQLEPK